MLSLWTLIAGVLHVRRVAMHYITFLQLVGGDCVNVCHVVGNSIIVQTPQGQFLATTAAPGTLTTPVTRPDGSKVYNLAYVWKFTCAFYNID